MKKMCAFFGLLLILVLTTGCDVKQPAVIQHNEECKCEKQKLLKRIGEDTEACKCPDKCKCKENCPCKGHCKCTKLCECGKTTITALKCSCEFCTCTKDSHCDDVRCPANAVK